MSLEGGVTSTAQREWLRWSFEAVAASREEVVQAAASRSGGDSSPEGAAERADASDPGMRSAGARGGGGVRTVTSFPQRFGPSTCGPQLFLPCAGVTVSLAKIRLPVAEAKAEFCVNSSDEESDGTVICWRMASAQGRLTVPFFTADQTTCPWCAPRGWAHLDIESHADCVWVSHSGYIGGGDTQERAVGGGGGDGTAEERADAAEAEATAALSAAWAAVADAERRTTEYAQSQKKSGSAFAEGP